eukprot:622570-Prorocentrum_lima.AAC.1
MPVAAPPSSPPAVVSTICTSPVGGALAAVPVAAPPIGSGIATSAVVGAATAGAVGASTKMPYG